MKLRSGKTMSNSQGGDGVARPGSQQTTGPRVDLLATKPKQPDEAEKEPATEAKPDYAELESKIRDLEEQLEHAEHARQSAVWAFEREQKFHYETRKHYITQGHVAQAMMVRYEEPHATPRAAWGNLVEYVGNLVSLFPRQVDWDDIDAARQQELLEITPRAPKYLAHKCHSNLVWLAWIYYLLNNNLFSPDCGRNHPKWTSPAWKAYALMRDEIAALASESNSDNTIRFHHWRFLATRLMGDSRYGSHNRTSAEHTDGAYLEKILLTKFEPFLRRNEEVWPECQRQLHLVVGFAVSFDYYRQLSKMDYEVLMRGPATDASVDFPFVPSDDMEAEIFCPAKAGEKVDMITLPLVLEHGEESGYHYDRVQTVRPMKVVTSAIFYEVADRVPASEHLPPIGEDDGMDVDVTEHGEGDGPSAN